MRGMLVPESDESLVRIVRSLVGELKVRIKGSIAEPSRRVTL